MERIPDLGYFGRKRTVDYSAQKDTPVSRWRLRFAAFPVPGQKMTFSRGVNVGAVLAKVRDRDGCFVKDLAQGGVHPEAGWRRARRSLL